MKKSYKFCNKRSNSNCEAFSYLFFYQKPKENMIVLLLKPRQN